MEDPHLVHHQMAPNYTQSLKTRTARQHILRILWCDMYHVQIELP
jgi:hypothetical protein